MYTQQEQDNYLCHYGILGMKWGVRKRRSTLNNDGRIRRRELRKMNRYVKKAYKKNPSSLNNYNAVVKSLNRSRDAAMKRDVAEAKKRGIDIDSDHMNYRHVTSVYDKSKKAINKALLMDAGYDAKKAEKGAEYLRKKYKNNYTLGGYRTSTYWID